MVAGVATIRETFRDIAAERSRKLFGHNDFARVAGLEFCGCTPLDFAVRRKPSRGRQICLSNASAMTAPNNRERIVARLIDDEVKESFINYSMSVIVARALPDVRDGLKPVHRRVLYSMFNNLGLVPGRPHKKSAT